MELFVQSNHCRSLANCRHCRNPASDIREGWAKFFILPEAPPGEIFPCPNGYTADNLPAAPVKAAAKETVPRKSAMAKSPRSKPAAPPRPRGPGSLVGAILKQLNIPQTNGCGCAAFAAKMDAWGWMGCLIHRQEIIDWFAGKARQHGIETTADAIWFLIGHALAGKSEGDRIALDPPKELP